MIRQVPAVPGGDEHIGMCTKKESHLAVCQAANKRPDESTFAIRELKTGGCNVNIGNLPTSVTSWEAEMRQNHIL